MGQPYAKKNGLILGPIPKISAKNNFFKKPITRPGTTEPAGNQDPGFWFPKTRNRRTPVPIFGFGQKLRIRIRLTSLLFNLFSFFGSRIRPKFIEVLLLSMVLSIIVGCDNQKLHSQVTFTFLNFLRN